MAKDRARYRALVEQLPALVYIDSNDVHARSLYVSPQVKDILGHDPKDYRGRRDYWHQATHPDDRGRVRDRWTRCVRTGEPFRDEYRFVRPDGSAIWVLDDARLARDPDGTPLHWQGVLLDITERKNIESALRTSEARYRALVEQVPAVVYEMGPGEEERHSLYVSPHVEELFGYTRQEWLDQPDIWTELLHPDDREIALAAHDLHNETGEPWRQDYRLIANDGRIVWVRDHAVLVGDEGGPPLAWYGIMLDISPLKQLEEQLRLANEELELRVLERTAQLEEANEMMTLEIGERKRAETEVGAAQERYRRLVEGLSAVVYIWHVGDLGGESSLSYTSPQVERMLGYTPAEWDSPTLWIERLHPHDRNRVLTATLHSEATGEGCDLEYRYLARDGRIVWVHSYASLLERDSEGRPLLFQGVLIDITQRKEAEGKAEYAQERLEGIESLGTMAFFDFDVEHEPALHVVFRYAAPALGRLIASSSEEIVRDPGRWLRGVHPDDRERVALDVEDQLRTGARSERSYRVIGPTGGVTWLRSVSHCVARNERGRPVRFQGVILDVTREKEEQDRMHRTDTALRSFVESMPGIPWIRHVGDGLGSGRTVYVGPQVKRILGYSEDELLAEPNHFDRMIHPADRARIRSRSAHHDRTGTPWSEEYRMIARDGRVVWFRSEGVASRDEEGATVWHGVAFDITAGKQRATAPLSKISSAPAKR